MVLIFRSVNSLRRLKNGGKILKKRILHIVLSLGTGGLENGIVNIINGCDPDKFHIDVLCLRELGELASRIENKDTRVFFFENSHQGLRTAVSQINSVCKKNDYQIIHTHGWATMLAGYLASLFNRKLIVMNGEHGTLYFDTWRQKALQKFLFNRMTINLSVSAVLVEEIAKRFQVSTDRFHPILNGVDVVRFAPDRNQKNKKRKDLGMQKGQFVIGSVGRLVEVKNYPCLLKAFSSISAKNPDARLVLAGDGPERKNLEDLANKLNISAFVKFLGRRDDIPAIMNTFDVFVLPSFREGLSNTILEAMSSGLPAVVSNVGGNPEIVVDHETGRLFETNNSIELSNILAELSNNQDMTNRMASSARKHILDNYSLATMVDNYQVIYEQLISKGKL